jgi:hypothetical protein
VSKATFESVVGAMTNPDYTALDRLMPHPVYALQHWVSILNPTEATFDAVVKALLDEAHERIARGHRKASAVRAKAQTSAKGGSVRTSTARCMAHGNSSGATGA